MQPDGIPAELLAIPRWLNWRWAYLSDKGKWTKPPYQTANGHKASSTDARTWTSSEAALAALGRYDGVGFALTPDDDLAGIDLDHCVDPTTGAIHGWALEVAKAVNSYTERSPSGTGLRIIVRAELPEGGRKRGDVEVYATGRYLTITGQRVQGAPATIESRQAEVEAFHAQHFPAVTQPEKPASCASAALSDAELLDLARKAKNAAKFEALYGGDNSQHRDDPSVGDLALCSQLAFYTQDAAQLDRLFRGSRRMRAKWGSKRGTSTYGADTIAEALTKVGETYTAPTSVGEASIIGDEKTGDDPGPLKVASPAPAQALRPRTLDEVHAVFTRWMGDEYDLGVLDAVLATSAAEKLDGDPLWMLVISGSGAAKTETVQALAGAGAIVTSTVTGDAALLSGTPAKQKAKGATGGLLRKIGDSGVLVIKDVTSILSMNRDTRGQVLAALRELHDGRWERNLGTDGGRTLTWTGRIVIIGAVTTAWDRAHDVISAMGDRFVIVRMDSTTGRLAAGRQAVGNTGDETRMRQEMTEAVGGLLSTVHAGAGITPTSEETERLLAAADLVTLARTGVDYDYRGDVIDAHAPEMPTRFAKQLAQLVRGAVAIGVDRRDAMRLALRCARDSMPPLRLAILDDIAANPSSSTSEVRRRLGKPRATVDRQLQSLQMLDVLVVDEEETFVAGRPATVWRYRLSERIQPEALSVPDLSPPGCIGVSEEGECVGQAPLPPTDISGTGADPAGHGAAAAAMAARIQREQAGGPL